MPSWPSGLMRSPAMVAAVVWRASSGCRDVTVRASILAARTPVGPLWPISLSTVLVTAASSSSSWYDLVDEPDGGHALRVEALGGHEERSGVRLANLRDDERRDHRRGDAQPRLGEAEARSLRRDDNIADGDQTRAAAERRAVDASDHRMAAGVDGAEHIRHT